MLADTASPASVRRDPPGRVRQDKPQDGAADDLRGRGVPGFLRRGLVLVLRLCQEIEEALPQVCVEGEPEDDADEPQQAAEREASEHPQEERGTRVASA